MQRVSYQLKVPVPFLYPDWWHALLAMNWPTSRSNEYLIVTVKPALSDHPTVQEKVVVIDRWSLKQGSWIQADFWKLCWTVANVVERTRTIYVTISHGRPGASGGLVWWFSRKLALWWLFLKRMWGQSNEFSSFWSLKTGKIRPLVQKLRVVGRVRQVVA